MDSVFKEDFILCYIDDILVFSKDVKEHIVHLQKFYNLIYQNGLVISTTNMEIAQTSIKYLSMDIENGKVKVQKHVFESISKYSDKLTEKNTVAKIFGMCKLYLKIFSFFSS